MSVPSRRFPRLRAAWAGLVLLLAGHAGATEEPSYDLVRAEGDFEIRSYQPMIIAETTVEGDLDAASSVGFRRLAGFIFGGNAGKAGTGSEKIAMTAPVVMEPGDAAPAQTTTMATESGNGRWRMHFVMPPGHSLASLPTPTDPRVSIRVLPTTTVAVVVFSGSAGNERIAEETARLQAWMKTQDLVPEAKPLIARYDPPWTLPLFRRNEIQIAYR